MSLPRHCRRLGWTLPRQATLLTIERRLAGGRAAAAAAYARALRDHRYASAAVTPPGPAERRALRQSLSASRGLAARLRGYRVIPPGGPRL